MFVYIVFLLLIIIFIVYRKKQLKPNIIVKFSSIYGILFLAFRLGPFKLLSYINLLLPALLTIYKKTSVHHSNKHARSNTKSLSEVQACKILEVEIIASKEEIKSAYRKHMLKNHPDQGGSRYIAEELTKARDILLKKR